MAHTGTSHGTHVLCVSLSLRGASCATHTTNTHTHTHTYTHETYIHEKRLITQPCLPQKSPIYLPKRPTHSQKSHVFPHKSPACLSLSAVLTIENGCSQNRTDDLNVPCIVCALSSVHSLRHSAHHDALLYGILGTMLWDGGY